MKVTDQELNDRLTCPEGWILYDIINPSDDVHFCAPDDQVAAFVAVALGDGWYDAQREGGDGDESVGALLSLAADPAASLKELLGAEPKTFIEERRTDIVRALGSVLYGSLHDRVMLIAALKGTEPSERGKFFDEWKDAKRSSMTDIMAKAERYAEGFTDE